MTGNPAPTIDTLLSASVRERSGQPALTLWGQRMSYAELDTAVDRLAAHLLNRLGGEERTLAGQRIAVMAPNVPALIVAMFAIWRSGAVVVPINARLREYDLSRILRDAEVRALVSVDSYQGYSFAEILPSLLPQFPTVRCCFIVDPLGEPVQEVAGPGESGEVEPLDSAIGALLYTSGTTGAPKGALVTHEREVVATRTLNAVLNARADDVCILVVPISHAFGMTCMLSAIAAGAHSVLIDSTFTQQPMLEAIQQQGATILHGSPALFTSFLKSTGGTGGAAGNLRTGFVAGSACPPQVLQQLDEAGVQILNLFGMTEIGAAACCRPDDPPEIRYTTSGHPLSGYEFRIAPVEGAEADTGEIQVRGPYITSGYYRQPNRSGSFEDGWFRTGDLGEIDPQGYVRISGRTKDVVQVGGLNVFPAEVEGFLLTHPDVAQAAVLGVPHDTMGEVLEAFVVPNPDASLTPTTLLQFARAQIAGYKLPYAIHILSELPMLPTGKPDRMALARSRNI